MVPTSETPPALGLSFPEQHFFQISIQYIFFLPSQAQWILALCHLNVVAEKSKKLLLSSLFSSSLVSRSCFSKFFSLICLIAKCNLKKWLWKGIDRSVTETAVIPPHSSYLNSLKNSVRTSSISSVYTKKNLATRSLNM